MNNPQVSNCVSLMIQRIVIFYTDIAKVETLNSLVAFETTCNKDVHIETPPNRWRRAESDNNGC